MKEDETDFSSVWTRHNTLHKSDEQQADKSVTLQLWQ